MEILAVLIVLAIIYGMSFLVTSGIVYLICQCFGFVFSWPPPFLIFSKFPIDKSINLCYNIYRKQERKF